MRTQVLPDTTLGVAHEVLRAATFNTFDTYGHCWLYGRYLTSIDTKQDMGYVRTFEF